MPRKQLRVRAKASSAGRSAMRAPARVRAVAAPSAPVPHEAMGHAAAADPARWASAMAHSHPAVRAGVMLQMQRTHGNAHVQRLLLDARLSGANALSIQRCAADSCGCGPGAGAVTSAGAQVARAAMGEASLHADTFDLAGSIHRSTGGEPLHHDARARLEPAMGLDLGHVKVHRDAEADMLSRSVNAEAFTSGDHIFFRRGSYDPHSAQGLHLLAHEITHTEQQARGAVGGVQHFGGVQVSEPGDAHELDAERKADAAISRLATGSESRAARSAGRARHGAAPRRHAAESRQRETRAANGPAVLQRSFQQDAAPGFTAKWTPFASVNGPPFFQQSNFDTDGFHEEFNIPPKSSGRLILLADVEWGSGGGGPGPNPVPTPVGPSEACKILQTVTKPIPVLNQIITFACNTKDPAAVIDSLNDAQLCALAALLGLGVGGLLCAALVAAGAAETIRNLIKDLLGLPHSPPGPKPGPGPSNGGATGKGRATIETRYFVGIDGKIQVVGLPPRIEANGTGAELVSPVDFIRTEIPDGVNIAFQPMIKGTTSGQTHVFQHQWDVDLKKPAAPPPLPFSFGVRLFPFVTGKELFEDEGSRQGQLLNWFQTMDPRVLSRITGRQIPVGVAGHASHLGDAAFNLALSERRAKRVTQMVSDFGGSFAGVVTFAFGELLAGGGDADNTGFFRRADVAVCGQLAGADAAGGPIVAPSGNDPTVCPEVSPKVPAIGATDGGAADNLPGQG